VRASADTIVAL